LSTACSSDSSDNSYGSRGGTSTSDPGSATEQSSSASTPLALSGRTNDNGTEDAVGRASLEVDLNDFAFEPTFFKVTSGQSLSVHLTNSGGNAHTFTAPALNIDETLQAGETRDVAVTIGTDATEFHCRFHQAAGMQGGFFL
jgi:plastocyanin